MRLSYLILYFIRSNTLSIILSQSLCVRAPPALPILVCDVWETAQPFSRAIVNIIVSAMYLVQILAKADAAVRSLASAVGGPGWHQFNQGPCFFDLLWNECIGYSLIISQIYLMVKQGSWIKSVKHFSIYSEDVNEPWNIEKYQPYFLIMTLC